MSRDLLGSVTIILTAAVFVVVPGWELLVEGPFHWGLTRPEFWQGGAEALILALILVATQFLHSERIRFGLGTVAIVLFFRRHGVDVAILIDILYFELCIALGAWVMRRSANRTPDSITDYLECFVLGFCVWSVCAWTMSAIGCGSLRDLRWLTVLLAIPAILARSRPWSVFMLKRGMPAPRPVRMCGAVLLSWFVIQVARSAVAMDFDGHWYGLRGEYVLVGGGSVFTSLGLVSPVHYFPKLYEVFLLPVSGLGSSTAITGMTILIASLLAAAMIELMQQAGLRDASAKLLATAACMTLPAVASSMLQSKGDVLAAFLLVFAATRAAEFLRTRNQASLIWYVALCMLALQARLTAYPYVAAMTTISSIAWLVSNAEQHELAAKQQMRMAIVGAVLTCIICSFVTARTLLLAGMPTVGPDALVKLWSLLGMHLSYPVGTLKWSYPKDWNDLPALAIDYLFRPQRLEHIQIAWVGNIWCWLALVGLSAPLIAGTRVRLRADAVLPGLALAATAFALMMCWAFQVRGGDGNYFIAGLVPATGLASCRALQALAERPLLRRALAAALLLFSAAQATCSFMSAAWTTGTRPFDLRLDRGIHELRHKNDLVLEAEGLPRINAFLHGQPRSTRVVGYVNHGPGFDLPVIFEHVDEITDARPDLTKNRAAFLRYLTDSQMRFLIVPNSSHVAKTSGTAVRSAVVAALVLELARDPNVRVIHDRDYDMYDIADLTKRVAVDPSGI